MIVLTILKVIGIVLLVILLLILLALGILLLVPIRYSSEGYKREAGDDYCIGFNAGWLLKLLRFEARYDPEGLCYSLKFLWMTLLCSSDEDDEDTEDKEEKDTSDEAIGEQEEERESKEEKLSNIMEKSAVDNKNKDKIDRAETSIETVTGKKDTVLSENKDLEEASDIYISSASDISSDPGTGSEALSCEVTKEDVVIDSSDAPDKSDISDAPINSTTSDTSVNPIMNESSPGDYMKSGKDDILLDESDIREIQSDDSEKGKSKVEQKKNQEKNSFYDKFTEKSRRILGKISEVTEKIRDIKSKIDDEENRKAVKLLISRTLYLLKHYRFRKLKGHFTYGSKDPSSVGSLMAILSLLYPLYGEHFYIEPVFDRDILAGDIAFKGRIRLIHILIVLIEFILNKKIRQFVLKRI